MRVVAMGGKVVRTFMSKVYRINGELAISRSIGDLEYSEFGLIHTPECREIDRDENDMFLVLACDGVFDVLRFGLFFFFFYFFFIF
jgi:protein phosphatase 1K